MQIQAPALNQVVYMMPVLIIFVTVLVLLVVDTISRTVRGKRVGISLLTSSIISFVGTFAALADTIYLWLLLNERGDSSGKAGVLKQLFMAHGPMLDDIGQGSIPVWNSGSLVIDYFALFVTLLVGIILAVTLLSIYTYVKEKDLYQVELYPLLLISASGMMLLGMSRDLLITFIAIEILSLPLYVLCGLDRSRETSRESALKYFLLGAFASGFFIYGAALVYGVAGHMNYASIAHYLEHASGGVSPILLIGLALVGGGFAFKMALVPFHGWAPDVYQGAPTPITGFMAAGVKLAMFCAALRLIQEALPMLDPRYWRDGLVLFAVLSMVGGNLLALHQMSAKRLLAYSAIAHSGYLAVGLAAGIPHSAVSILTYLVAYSLAGLGVFVLITYLSPKGQDDIYLDEMHELWKRAPVSSLAMTILLLSMGGLPLTAGFIGKLLVFTDAWQAGLHGLVIIAVLNSVVSFYYYLRFVLAMYMQEKAKGSPELVLAPMPMPYVVAGVFTVVSTVLLGVMPRILLEWVGLCTLGS